MQHQSNPLPFALACLLATSTLTVRADEVAEKGRDIFKQHQHAVVTVQTVLKISYSGAGKSSENRQEITGTVVDPSGLTVLSLSACDPTDMYQRMMPDDAARNKLEIEVTDIKLLLDDGTEIPSEIVLRDKDMDLAFIRPKTKPASPMAALDFAKSASAQVLDQLITLNRLNSAAGRAYAASTERISAVIQKPRMFYIPDSNMSSTTLGSPAFNLEGKVVGVFVMRAISAKGSGSRNPRENMTSIILPAEDVVKAAKQAPDAKGGEEKKDTPKESK
jgi:hypothetical protein